jgi:hypothetical protein
MCSVDVRFTDGPDDMLTWVASEPGFMQRASHALAATGGTWLVDPVDHPHVRDRLAGMPPVVAVFQLLDRHGRDCSAMAADLGVPLMQVPREPVPSSPFDVVVVRDARGWHESALWWPERRALVVAEAVGTSPYCRSRPSDVIGPHPMMRATPPRALVGFDAHHVLVGHGDPLHRHDAGALTDAAVAHARGSTPRWLLSLATGSVRRADRRSPNVTGR